MNNITRDDAREAIRSRLDCRDYITKAAKSNFICPFCGSGAGSKGTGGLVYYPKTNTCACFSGCVQPGEKAHSYDVLDLIQNYHGVDYNGALEIGANILNIPLEALHNTRISAERAFSKKDDKMNTENEKRENGALESAGEAQGNLIDYTEYYKKCLQAIEAPEAISYLEARGITLETAKKYNIGYDGEWISPKTIRKLQAEGNTWRPPATRRIIVPVNYHFYVVRAIDPGVEVEKLHETGGGEVDEVLNSSALYNNTDNPVFITEGFFDYLSILQEGAADGAEAISINSTSNISVLLNLLKEKPTNKTLILSLDNDSNGRKVSETLKQGLKALNVKFIEYNICGDEKDANEALIKDKASFLTAIREAIREAKKEPPNEIDLFLDKIQTDIYKPYETGLKFFDNMLGGGLTKQTLTIIMAAPGAGKTTLCQQLARTIAEKQKQEIIYLNLEMSREQMIAKDISSILFNRNIYKTTNDILRGYQWGEIEKACIIKAIEEYKETINPYLKYNPGDLTSDLAAINSFLTARGEQAKAQGKPAPAVILDYLHLVTDKETKEAQERLKVVVEVFKSYARKYDTFVIAISATNRNSNSNGKITLESGRDSSNIEYTADNVISLNFLALDSGKIKPSESNKIEKLKSQNEKQMILRLLKSRFSQPGKYKRVWFNSASNIFFTSTKKTFTDHIKDSEEFTDAEDTPFD